MMVSAVDCRCSLLWPAKHIACPTFSADTTLKSEKGWFQVFEELATALEQPDVVDLGGGSPACSDREGIVDSCFFVEEDDAVHERMPFTEVHIHPLRKMLTRGVNWICDGCMKRGDALTDRYRCIEGCDFDLCPTCYADANHCKARAGGLPAQPTRARIVNYACPAVARPASARVVNYALGVAGVSSSEEVSESNDSTPEDVVPMHGLSCVPGFGRMKSKGKGKLPQLSGKGKGIATGESESLYKPECGESAWIDEVDLLDGRQPGQGQSKGKGRSGSVSSLPTGTGTAMANGNTSSSKKGGKSKGRSKGKSKDKRSQQKVHRFRRPS